MAASTGKPLIDQLEAIRPDGLSYNAWAMKAGVSRTVFNDVRKRNNVRHDTLAKLLAAVDMNFADFEARNGLVQSEVRGTGMSVREIERPWRGPLADKRVPLLGTAYGGEWSDGVEMTELHLSEVLDYLARPPSLDNDADSYAVEIVGESMAPRFEPGERVWVSPKSPVRPGDDVIVQLRNGRDSVGEDADPAHSDRVATVLIKRIVRQNSKFVELMQFNPPETFTVEVERVAAIHRVRGRL